MKKIRRILWPIVAVFLIVSISLNIINQFTTLKEAKKKNQSLEDKIEILETEKQILIKKIEYATSGAFVEQETHDKLGLGRINDVWIEMTKETNIDLRPEFNESKEISNLKKWWNLFVR